MICWCGSMKLTTKDAEFLIKLKRLVEEKDLRIELKADGIKRLVLRKNYGDRIEREFGLTRQGVRWRFDRLFNQVYLEAYLTIFWIETSFGIELRPLILEAARHRTAIMRRQSREGRIIMPKKDPR